MITTRRSPTKKTTEVPPGDAFGVRTKIVKATGKSSRYASDSVRVIPAPPAEKGKRPRDPDEHLGVVLEATDGHQAVCVFAPGQLNGAGRRGARTGAAHRRTFCGSVNSFSSSVAATTYRASMTAFATAPCAPGQTSAYL